MAGSSSSSSPAGSDDDDDGGVGETSDRIMYLRAKIAKLEKKSKKIDKKKKKIDKKQRKREERARRKSRTDTDGDDDDDNDVASGAGPSSSSSVSGGREEWMTAGDVDSLVFPCVSLAEVKAERKKEREERLYETDAAFRSKVEARKLMENPGSHSRELNPYWKDGGTGLPAEDPTGAPSSSSPSSSSAGTHSASSSLSSRHGKKAVGDGGSTWLRRAFRRAQEMAEEQGRPVEEVVAERWGSVEKLEEMMSAAEGRRVRLNLDPKVGGGPRGARKDGDEERSSRYKRPAHDDDDAEDEDRRRRREGSSRSSGNSKGWRKPAPVSAAEQLPSPAPEGSGGGRETKTKDRNGGDVPKPNKKPPAADKDDDGGQGPRPKPADEKEKEKKETEESEEDYLLTPAEMNALGAKIVRAEITGNKALAAKLQAKLDRAREATRGKRVIVAPTPPAAASATVAGRRNINSSNNGGGFGGSGGGFGGGGFGGGGGRGRGQMGRTTAEMQKYKLDDRYSLKSMFEAEKSAVDASDGDRAVYAKMAARAAKSAALGAEERVQPDEWDEDAAGVRDGDGARAGAGPRAAKEEARAALRSEEAERRRAAALEKSRSRQLDECRRCFNSPRMIKHLMIAMGSFTYLSVPGCESLTEGHCLISPCAHVPSSTDADENVWEEVQNFGRALVRMFRDRGEDCVFFEYFRGAKSKAGFPHLTIECVPLPLELGDQAPIYFKKALLECDTEWAQNKRVVDIARGRDVRSVVPRGLPYFFVSFGWDELGFAHVIEDEALFPPNFAHEIIGGMMEADPRLWRKPRWEDFSAHCEKVEALSKAFAPYDWTVPSS